MSKCKPAKQAYPIGAKVEVCMRGAWYQATVYGLAGEYIIARADGYWYDEYAAEDVRPIRTERERWVDEAHKIANDDSGSATFRAIGAVYDALKSGTLKDPEAE